MSVLNLELINYFTSWTIEFMIAMLSLHSALLLQLSLWPRVASNSWSVTEYLNWHLMKTSDCRFEINYWAP